MSRSLRCCLLALFLSIPLAAAAQSVVVSVRAVTDEHDSGIHLFGFHDDALLGIDDYDVPEPPLPPSGYLALAFTMDLPDVPLPNRWRNELRPSMIFEDQAETWHLLVDTDETGYLLLLFDVPEGAQYPLALEIASETRGGERHDIPAEVLWPITDHHMELLLTLTSSVALPDERASWSGIKALFGP